LHDELAELVRAGLTPAQALRSATLNGATFMGAAARSGSITEGKEADLVLLTANPLADIANTRKIAAVVSRGKIYSRQDLGKMLAAIKNN